MFKFFHYICNIVTAMNEQKTIKWSNITRLPEWDEKFCDVYRGVRNGKSVMLKCLKPEFAEIPEFQQMLEKEFDARCHLEHPNIVMITNYEHVPGLGPSIITENVFGTSLKNLIYRKKITPQLLQKIETQLPDALEYIQENHIVHHPLTAERIIITEKKRDIKLIDVGFEQRNSLTANDCSGDIYNYGAILNDILDVMSQNKLQQMLDPIVSMKFHSLRKIASKCMATDTRQGYHDVQELRLDIERKSSGTIYTFVVAFIVVMCAILFWLSSTKAPETKNASRDEQPAAIEQSIR